MTTSGRTYRLVVGLSALSAALGLGREILLLSALGLTRENDRLQLCLSITYTISLLGEPIRLASMNLLQRRLRSREVGGFYAVAVTVAVAVAIFYGFQFQAPAWWWIPAAAIAGLANLTYSGLLPRLQARGDLLTVHAVSVLPNLLLFVGLAVLAGGLRWRADSVMVALFLAAPLTQLVLFAMIATRLDSLTTSSGATLSRKQLSAHLGSAVGMQLAQAGLRTGLGQSASGTLALFVLLARAADTARAILVDTYIAVQLRRWIGDRRPAPEERPSWRGAGTLWVAGTALVVALVQASLGVVMAGLIATGALIGAVVRIRYHRLNTGAQPTGLSTRIALAEIAVGIGVMVGAAVPVVTDRWLVWLVYVARPVTLAWLTQTTPLREGS